MNKIAYNKLNMNSVMYGSVRNIHNTSDISFIVYHRLYYYVDVLTNLYNRTLMYDDAICDAIQNTIEGLINV